MNESISFSIKKLMKSRILIYIYITLSMSLINCEIFKESTIKLIIFDDPKRTHSILVNGKPLLKSNRTSDGLYVGDYRIYDENEVSIQILAENNTLLEERITSGSYLVNLSDNHILSYQEISYGRNCSPCKFGKLSDIGLIKFSDNTDVLSYKFNETPPDEIKVKRSGGLSERQFFQLTARPKKLIE